MRHSVILIPALNPDERLTPYVRELMKRGFSHIIVVDDGSGPEYAEVFQKLSGLGCIVLKHEVNLGKGRALKDGMKEFAGRFAQDREICGIITADSDGQHLVEDVIRMDEKMYEEQTDITGRNKKLLLLGVRNFNRPDVPPKSRFGNKLTCSVFRLLYGTYISDTQTGLRGISTAGVSNFMTLKGERFEYETNMLIAAVRGKLSILEMEISTVYLNENSGTHFRPVVDSLKIYRVLFGEFLKFIASSLSASVIDILLFSLFVKLFPAMWGIWAATLLARAVSSLYNYFINRSVVFQSGADMKKALVKYYGLCVIQGACSAALVSVIVYFGGLPKTGCKILVDVFLFFISYQVQRGFVFNSGENEE